MSPSRCGAKSISAWNSEPEEDDREGQDVNDAVSHQAGTGTRLRLVHFAKYYRYSADTSLQLLQPKTRSAMGKSDSVKALSRLLEAISENPYDISVHAQHIRLASDSGDGEQLDAAREMFTGFWAATEDVWLPILEAKEKSEDVNTLDGLQAVLSQYRLAEEDYLCELPLCQGVVCACLNSSV